MKINNNNVISRRLLPRHSFVVQCFNDDGLKFIKNFRETWKQLPYKVRRDILKLWRTNRVPYFELSNWIDNDKNAYVKMPRMEMKFHQENFRSLNDEDARYIIAHELAHVCQITMGRKPGGENEDENEEHADNLVKEWGFKSLLNNETKMYQKVNRMLLEISSSN